MKTSIFLILLFAAVSTLAWATKYESGNTDATPTVAYGYYNNGTVNSLVAVKTDVDGTIYLH